MSQTTLPVEEEKSKVTIIIDPKYPNKGWISDEPKQYQSEVKVFFDFMKHHPTITGPITFSLSTKLSKQDASDLENFFNIYRDTIPKLPGWIQIKIE